MPKEKKLQPMPNAAFKGMIWFYRLCDFFWNPKRHLKKISLKEGMTVVDYGCGPGHYSLPVAESVGLRGIKSLQ